MHAALKHVDHRPWPLPSGPWIMVQVWHDLLFAHWPVKTEILRGIVPPELPLDTFNGSAWIAVVPFWMSGVRPRAIPTIPGLSRFPELNVRTYVTLGGKAGVFFFSLDAANAPAVWAARTFYHLPYFKAKMRADLDGNEIIYQSKRLEKQVAEFQGRFKPCANVQFRAKGTLENWLTERYCLYTVHSNQVYRAEIHHPQWPLQDAEADIRINTMASASGIELPDAKPLLHFSRKLEVLIWPLKRI